MKYSTYMGVIFAALMLFTDAASSFKRCKENQKCGKGECCLRGFCMPFVPVGRRCNLLSQIMRQQCPCAIGSSCILVEEFSDVFPIEEPLCQRIENPEVLEMIENGDWKHIERNSLED